jgi:competence protein ComEC
MRIIKTEQRAIWKLAPFLRLLVPLISGILAENYFPVSVRFPVLMFFSSFLLLMFCNRMRFSNFFGSAWTAGFAIQTAFYSFGSLLVHIHSDIQVGQTACYSRDQSNLLLLRVLSDPVQKQNTFKTVAMVSWLIKNQTCFFENEKILIYFREKPDPRKTSVGSLIIIRKPLRPIENIKGFDFDYKRYCRLKHIYAQVYLKENEFECIGREKEISVFSRLEPIRKKLLIIIKNKIPDKSEYALLEALMVGFTDDLDPGLMKSYADTGVIHIIAISGLHLALICHILQLALQKLGHKKQLQWIKFFLIVIILWGYSLLSGASPSVIRAATMFTMTLLAGNLTREAVLYNSLSASAFLLLCFDPNWIWDTGFQLSYLAVLSLRLFAKPVRDLLTLQNKALSAIWDAASVSISAQILTTPISIFYFHRFPTYFLVANLLAVPLSSCILVGGILLCGVASFYPLGASLGLALGFGIRFLNGFVRYVSLLPGAVAGPLNCTLPQLVLIYFIIFSFYRFLKNKEKSWLIAGLCIIVLFQFFGIVN